MTHKEIYDMLFKILEQLNADCSLHEKSFYTDFYANSEYHLGRVDGLRLSIRLIQDLLQKMAVN